MVNNWQEESIENLCEIVNGKTPLRSNSEYWTNGNVPWFTIEDQRRQGKIIYKTNQFITQKALEKSGVKLVPKDSVLLCCTASVGEYAITRIPITTNQQFNSLIIKNKEKIIPDYLFQYSGMITKKLNSMMGKTTFGFVSVGMLGSIKIKFPDLATQQKIALILSTVDEEIQKTDQIIEKTEKLKKGLMSDLLTKGRTMCIKEISEVKRGASPRPISDTKYFDISGRGWIRISDVTSTYKYLDKTTQYLSKEGENLSVKVDPGDLIMSICATVGKPVFVNIPSCIHDGFVLFRNINKLLIDPEFFFYSLLLNKDRIKSKGQTGSQMNINSTIVENTEIQIPELMKQKEIVNILRSTDKKLEVYSQELKRLKTLKNGLMNDIFSQKVEVLNA